MAPVRFMLGEWLVDPSANSLGRATELRQIEPRAMDVLCRLCRQPGEVVGTTELLEACWGDAGTADNPLHKTVTLLRRALGDSSTAPVYIETIRKRGYRVVAPVRAETVARAGSWVHATPFRGLQAFEEQHAPIFFGRGQAMAKLLDTLRQQQAAGCALVMVLGPSGAGKTSLIRAGLLPRLLSGANEPAVAAVLHLNCGDIGTAGLHVALGSALLDADTAAELPVFPGASAQTLGDALRRDSAAIAAMLAQRLGARRLALCVDQFEAIFRLPGIVDEDRQSFVAALEVLARSGSVVVIVACRNDFYPHVAAFAPLLELKERGGHFDVNPPGRGELAQMVRLPAQAASIAFEADPATGVGLDEVLCDALSAGTDVLPLLEFCLHELYLQRNDAGCMTYAVFHALGGIEGALGARAEQVVAGLSDPHREAVPAVLARLIRVTEDELAVTSQRAPWTALTTAAERELVQVLVDERLFVSGLHGGVPTFGIAHEAVLRRWPRVVAWIDQHRQTLQLRSRTAAQAALWQAAGEPRDLLLQAGIQVTQARTLLAHPQFPIGPLERRFVEASVRRARRGEQLRLVTLLIVLGLAGLAAALGVLARQSERVAEQRRVEAEGLMGFMLGEFVDKLRPLGRLDLLDSVSDRALRYLSGNDGDAGNAAAQTRRAQALQVIGEVALARTEPARATDALTAARAILQRQLAAQPDNAEVLKSIGNNAFYLGQIRYDRKEWAAARAHMQDYLRFGERLAAVQPGAAAWIEQSFAHSSLGSIAVETGDLAGAARAFEASIALKVRALAQRPGDRTLQGELADTLSWVASVHERLGRFDAARAGYQRELAIVAALYAASGSEAVYAQRVAHAHVHLAELDRSQGRLAEARAGLRSAERLLQAIVAQDGSNRDWQAMLGNVRLKIADLDAEEGAPVGGLDSLRALHDTFGSLSSLDPNKVDLRRLQALTEQRQAGLYLRRGDLGHARRVLDSALAALAQLRRQVPDDASVREALVDGLLESAELARLEGMPGRALDACRTALTLLDPVRDSRDWRVLAPWVRAQVCAGRTQEVSQQRAWLRQMAYRDPVYVRQVEKRLSIKGE